MEREARWYFRRFLQHREVSADRTQQTGRGYPCLRAVPRDGLCASRGEARRLIAQGGGYVNDRQIGAFDEKIGLADADEKGEIRLRKGKKRYVILTVR